MQSEALHRLAEFGREAAGALAASDAWSRVCANPPLLAQLRDALLENECPPVERKLAREMLSASGLTALSSRVREFESRTASAAPAQPDDFPLVVLLNRVARTLGLLPLVAPSPLHERAPYCAVCGLTMDGMAADGTPLQVVGNPPYDPDSVEPAGGEVLFGLLLLRSMVPPPGEPGWVLWREAACGCTMLDHCYIVLRGASAACPGTACPACGGEIEACRRSFWRYGVSGTPHELGLEDEHSAPEDSEAKAALDKAKEALDPRKLAVVRRFLPPRLALDLDDMQHYYGGGSFPNGAEAEGSRRKWSWRNGRGL
ncbi:hypothetical protein EMIHUDRAFT_197713 [Emiliania huxleyi CCMP1516]|uniref:Uncharacterized protein n=2 Tax=Emiliania huxleyi TaxID=2903 RepID=A0A0D3IDL6_EMIH1|nr:hypothetical protein EMIHUDRAFT_197713 [Emiliania huxleyi CCMP1516]EOD09351.1 hypothetical protein EMIHUDRAFT_197713 [Emiliania huxleyi CCMP1516]|eukprot:XP_005761780.1 hypothetical protein EMIHUDRAFT_197713 [Emiliania huxleyi CCMP1516]